jgi:hypothetical protein
MLAVRGRISGRARVAALLAAAGELAMDKTPTATNRTTTPAVIGRIVAGRSPVRPSRIRRDMSRRRPRFVIHEHAARTLRTQPESVESGRTIEDLAGSE